MIDHIKTEVGAVEGTLGSRHREDVVVHLADCEVLGPQPPIPSDYGSGCLTD